jgi:hypothetical protein
MQPFGPLGPRRPSWPSRVGKGSARQSAAQATLERILREAYTAPSDPKYWDQLEARIMSRVQQPGAGRALRGWPAAYRSWARAGLAAAGVAAVAAGLATWTTRNTAGRIAYETVLDVPTAIPVQADRRFIDVSEQEATVRYVLSH